MNITIVIALALLEEKEINTVYKHQFERLTNKLSGHMNVLVLSKLEELKALKELGDRIYITDSGELAHRLVLEQNCVVAFLHQGSRKESFSDCKFAVEGFEELEADYFVKLYQRHRGEPWQILATSRCVLRETILQDIPEFYRIYEEPEITKYMDRLFECQEEELLYAKNYIETIYGFYGYGLWTVIDKETGLVIGKAGLSHRGGHEDVELGFVIAVGHQRKGYGEEICRAILEYAKEELNFRKIQALIKSCNVPSISLCEKLGFSYKEQVIEKGEEYERYVWEAAEQ